MAKSSPRNYKLLTIKRLFSLAGNRCAFPGCEVTFLSSETETNFSNICHIEDANKDTHKADRFNPNMSDIQRADYNNLILLCPVHHIETNDTAKNDVSSLKLMKREHEKRINQLQLGKNPINKYPSMLSLLINEMGSKLLEEDVESNVKTAPSTEEKILYNNVELYKHTIEEYSVYQGKLNSIYEEIEKQGSSKKSFLLRNINSFYLKEKGKYKNIGEIRANADNIFESIENQIWATIDDSANINNNLPIEALKEAILIVMVDAFMRCKILEGPVKK